MNKKIFLIVFLSVLMILPYKVNALSLSDGTTVDGNNLYLYFEENNLYKEEYPYCIFRNSYINCFESIENIVYKNSNVYVTSKGYYWTIDWSGLHDNSANYNNNGFNNITLTNFDILNEDGSIYMAKNWSLGSAATTTYFINFNSNLSNYEIVVKDSENNVISANEDGTYTLESGTYYYSATKGGYKELNDIEFIVSQDEIIIIEFEKIIDDSNIKIIFSSIISNIENIISVIYINQLFVYLISVIMIFFIVFLIVKLLKGD